MTLRSRSQSVANVFADDGSSDDDQPPGSARSMHSQLQNAVLRAAAKAKAEVAAKANEATPPPNGNGMQGTLVRVIELHAKVLEWDAAKVRTWVSDALIGLKYPPQIVSEITTSFSENMVNGRAFQKLELEDWKALVPLIGPRRELIDASRNIKDDPLPPPPPAPVPRGGASPLNMRKRAQLTQVPRAGTPDAKGSSTPDNTSFEITPIADRKESVASLAELMVIEATPEQPSKNNSREKLLGSPSQDVGVTPTSGPAQAKPFIPHLDLNALPKAPDPTASERKRMNRNSLMVSWDMLHRISQFSNVPLIDTDFIPGAGLPRFQRMKERIFYEFLRIVFLWKTLFNIIGISEMLLGLIPVISTGLCYRFEITANYNPGLFLTAIVFPLSFAVNAAYQRREQALQHLAYLRGVTTALYLTHRMWKKIPDLPPNWINQTSALIKTIFNTLRLYFVAGNEREKEHYLDTLYKEFAQLSVQNDSLRLAGLAPPLCTRPIHDLRECIVAFERLRVLADYRTPSAIRAFIRCAIVLAPILLSPYFAFIGTKDSLVVALIVPWFFYLILKAMANIQSMLENPFMTANFSGQDDINLEYMKDAIENVQHEDDEKARKLAEAEEAKKLKLEKEREAAKAKTLVQSTTTGEPTPDDKLTMRVINKMRFLSRKAKEVAKEEDTPGTPEPLPVAPLPSEPVMGDPNECASPSPASSPPSAPAAVTSPSEPKVQKVPEVVVLQVPAPGSVNSDGSEADLPPPIANDTKKEQIGVLGAGGGKPGRKNMYIFDSSGMGAGNRVGDEEEGADYDLLDL